MNYEKEKGIAKSVLRFASYYDRMPVGEQQKIKKRLINLSPIILGFILEELKEDMEYLTFFYLAEECYINQIASNDNQRKFLKESLEYQIDNYKRSLSGEEITIDTYNEGKRCNKFARRSKSKKKSKGKAYARVRVKEIGF